MVEERWPSTGPRVYDEVFFLDEQRPPTKAE
jgi:hypothetical protein